MRTVTNNAQSYVAGRTGKEGRFYIVFAKYFVVEYFAFGTAAQLRVFKQWPNQSASFKTEPAAATTKQQQQQSNIQISIFPVS